MTSALVGALVVGFGVAPVAAEEYPTWDEVVAIKNDAANAQAEVRRLEGLIADLQRRVDEAMAVAAAAGEKLQAAETAYLGALERTTNLRQQADEANAKAKTSEQQAGQMAAQAARRGTEDLTANLLVSPNTDDLLRTLELSSKVSEQAYSIYERALQDKNTAQSLTDQAAVAEAELKVLRDASQAAYDEAQAASAAVGAALNEQQTRLGPLQQQAAYLAGQVPLAEAQYKAGVQARLQAEVNFDSGFVSDQGWVRPTGGSITSTFGWRVLEGSNNYHKGIDFAPGCGANIYAASSGTVTLALYGWNGGYGNYVEVTHPDGTFTRYSHIQNGGIKVQYGQQVGIGQLLGTVGDTGQAYGCNMHFETNNGGYVNPIGFMQQRGINVGG